MRIYKENGKIIIDGEDKTEIKIGEFINITTEDILITGMHIKRDNEFINPEIYKDENDCIIFDSKDKVEIKGNNEEDEYMIKIDKDITDKELKFINTTFKMSVSQYIIHLGLHQAKMFEGCTVISS